MKSLFIFLFLTFAAELIQCAVFLEETFVKKGSKEFEEGFRCHSEQFGLMKPSVEKSLHKKNMCVTAVCAQNGIINYYGCGSVYAGSGCRVIETDLSKPHPQCCPSVKCEIY